MARGKTLYSVSTLEKDMKRIVGKRAWDKWYNNTEIPCAIDEDSMYGRNIEYYFTPELREKIVSYMKSHRRSRLYRAWNGMKGPLRFDVYSFM